MRKDQWKIEEIAEDFCFTCKDGGHLRVCDFKKCLKAYHPQCVGEDETFLESNDRWTCDSHSCNCGNGSSYHCYCCPTSFCDICITSADFIKLKKEKGFCIKCLRLAKLIEEDRPIDSDGEEVDFNNTESYEFLFKDYWEIVKDQEGLTIVDVQEADDLLKRGESLQNGIDSEKDKQDDEWMSEQEEVEDWDDTRKSKLKRGKQSMKTPIKKSKKGRVFNGWASEELYTFLSSIGKDTSEPLSQLDVTEIVKDYVQSNNLYPENKRRKNHVIPDDKLYSLFRKKKLKYHKIFDSLKSHLAEEQSDGVGDFSLSSEEDNGSVSCKKRKILNSDNKLPRLEPNNSKKKVQEQPKSIYAAIVKDNIKLAYLKKSLVLELLNFSEAFENKVVGCFVKIKNDPKDFYYLVQKSHQIGQVTGIKKIESVYKVGERSTDIVLCVSNFSKDVKISMLADGDVEEEECEDLRELVKKGLYKQPLTEELERKIKCVHEDIVNHWIDKELVKLQRQIDRASEKGWRKELNEFIERRVLLQTPEERTRLLKTIPQVIPYKSDIDANIDDTLNLHVVNEGTEAAMPENAAEGKPRDVTRNNTVITTVSFENTAEGKIEGELTYGAEAQAQEIDDGHTCDVEVQEQEVEESGPKSTINEEKMSTNKDEEAKQRNKDKEAKPSNPNTSEIEIIDLDEEEDDDVIITDVSKESKPATPNATSGNQAIWHYKDPSGIVQGPFTLYSLRHWEQCGYFDDDFKVWKLGQGEEDASLLNVALRLLP